MLRVGDHEPPQIVLAHHADVALVPIVILATAYQRQAAVEAQHPTPFLPHRRFTHDDLMDCNQLATEPPRDFRWLQLLRGWGHDEENTTVFS